ncbi:MAG: M48 family metallopeptidase [bacterium]
MSSRTTFNPEEYLYPDDRQMMTRLESVRGLKEMATRFINEISEPWVSGQLAGTGVRASERQLPELHKQVYTLAASFGVPMPHVYIVSDSNLNAVTYGTGNQCFISLTNALYEQLSPQQLAFVLGHEIGHIHCRHVLYITMARWFFDDTKSRSDRNANELLTAIMDWMRTSEISADRAGLVACGDKDVACKALVAMVVGSRNLAEKIDVNEYIAEQALSLQFNPLALQRQNFESHPYMPFRIGELLEFADGTAYRQLSEKWRESMSFEEAAIDIKLY